MVILVTGGAGFIGSNYVLRHLREHPEDRVVVLDALTYAGNLQNLASVEGDARLRFVKGDICDAEVVDALVAEEKPDSIVHFAAESHVDQSILGSRVFVQTNVIGTQTLLDATKKHGVRRFLMVSTDEVYGALGAEGAFTEETPVAPNNPYSASKAASDLLALAYHRTHGLDVVITRCSNNYGPLQFPEKLIPLMIINALEEKPLPVYGDGLQIRDWIHVEDHAAAVDRVLADGRSGEVYNIGARNEHTNLEVVKRIVKRLGKSESLITHVKDRPGHDRRYAIDPKKIETELGWKPSRTTAEGLEETIQWYLDHRSWWEQVKSGAYRDYFERQYGERLRGAQA
jgi:dTDP-glucose 4,6-dehydratase